MITGRARELAVYIDRGPWKVLRSEVDGSLMLVDQAENPLALIYAGHDLALYLAELAPATLLDLEAGR